MREQITAGDTLDFVTTLPDYPAATWTLTFYLTPRTVDAGTAISFSCIPGDGENDHRAAVTATVTGSWTAGEYSWSSFVSASGVRYRVADGTVTILPDITQATSWDGRSRAEIALEDAKTALATFQSTGGRVKAYTIAGRSMEFDAAGDILRLVSYWQVEVTREQAAKAVSKGLSDPRRIYLRSGHA
jgi:hypothetical protein